MCRLWMGIALFPFLVCFSAACGSGQSQADAVRAGFAALVRAAENGDSRELCGHLVAVGEHQSPAAWSAEIRSLNTPAGYTRHEAQVSECVRYYTTHPDALRRWEREGKVLRRSALRHILVHGDTARATLAGPGGRTAPVYFGSVKGVWELLVLTA